MRESPDHGWAVHLPPSHCDLCGRSSNDPHVMVWTDTHTWEGIRGASVCLGCLREMTEGLSKSIPTAADVKP